MAEDEATWADILRNLEVWEKEEVGRISLVLFSIRLLVNYMCVSLAKGRFSMIINTNGTCDSSLLLFCKLPRVFVFILPFPIAFSHTTKHFQPIYSRILAEIVAALSRSEDIVKMVSSDSLTKLLLTRFQLKI